MTDVQCSSHSEEDCSKSWSGWKYSRTEVPVVLFVARSDRYPSAATRLKKRLGKYPARARVIANRKMKQATQRPEMKVLIFHGQYLWVLLRPAQNSSAKKHIQILPRSDVTWVRLSLNRFFSFPAQQKVSFCSSYFQGQISK